MRYVVFDVETPNRYNNRMSAIGIAVVEDGRIADTFYSLVDPEQPFDWFNTQLTGIDSEAVAGAPTFYELWGRIEPLLSSGAASRLSSWEIRDRSRITSSMGSTYIIRTPPQRIPRIRARISGPCRIHFSRNGVTSCAKYDLV